jgi:hypothetical protein
MVRGMVWVDTWIDFEIFASIIISTYKDILFQCCSDKNPEYMHEHCAKTCGICTPSSNEIVIAEAQCTNAFHSCREWAERGKWFVDRCT